MKKLFCCLLCISALLCCDKIDRYPDVGIKPDPEKPEQEKPEEEKPSGPPQNTIYEFNAKSTKRLCPFCDGENSVGAKFCNICGRGL